MGTLLYGTPPTEHDIEDRLLAHLQVVIVNKFRRGESFSFSLAAVPGSGTGRVALWMNPTIPVQFSFHGSRIPALNPAWIQELMSEANSGRGLSLVPEPQHRDLPARNTAAA